jgi:hypothetical protein
MMKLKKATVITGIVLAGLVGGGSTVPANALIFNFTPATGTPSNVTAGFQQAGNLWSSILTDNVTVNIDINFTPLAATDLGGADSYNYNYTYAEVYNALNSRKTSTDDFAAVSSLSSNPALTRLINLTQNNPSGAGSATPYQYTATATDFTMQVTTANAKALGLLTNYTGIDATINFNSLTTWDFNHGATIAAGSYDFVGVAAHEIGHVLGFYSGVDSTINGDPNGLPLDDSQLNNVQPLDLFRYSAESRDLVIIDATGSTADKYFSLDRGITKIAAFSQGVPYSNYQAGHWANNQNLGIMDPTTANGELVQIVENDKRAFDAIGWTRASSQNVPEPENFVGTLICAAFGVRMIIQRKKKLADSINT